MSFHRNLVETSTFIVEKKMVATAHPKLKMENLVFKYSTGKEILAMSV